MHSSGKSNKKYAFEPRTQIVNVNPEDEVEQTNVEDSWGQLVSRSADGPHVNLHNIDADEQGRFNVHTLGRSTKCSIVFSGSDRISNKHCTIYCKRNIANPNKPSLEAWIEDTSANGTFINGETRLTKNVPRLLQHRDEIFLVNPERKRLATPGSKIIEDVDQNSFVIMLNLPAFVDTFVPASRDNDMQMAQNSELSEGAFSGIARIERSNTVNLLLSKNRSIYDYYEIKSLLGEGTSGHVYHGTDKESGKDWAVKIIPTKNLSQLDAASNKGGKSEREPIPNEPTKEAELLLSLRHPHIIHFEDIFADNKRLFLVVELASGGDLFDRIVKKKSYPEHEAKIVMTQILQAMAYLHERNIAHRDIKPENILLVNKQSDVDVKLADFGLANKVDVPSSLTINSETAQYCAPEVLQRLDTVTSAGSYSLAADMWSLGVILFVLLEGNYPFNEMNLRQQISLAQYSFQAPVWEKISSEAKELIQQLLVIDPNSRLTAQQALQSKWFQQQTSVVSSAHVPTFIASVPLLLPPVPEGSSPSTTSKVDEGRVHIAEADRSTTGTGQSKLQQPATPPSLARAQANEPMLTLNPLTAQPYTLDEVLQQAEQALGAIPQITPWLPSGNKGKKRSNSEVVSDEFTTAPRYRSSSDFEAQHSAKKGENFDLQSNKPVTDDVDIQHKLRDIYEKFATQKQLSAAERLARDGYVRPAPRGNDGARTAGLPLVPPPRGRAPDGGDDDGDAPNEEPEGPGRQRRGSFEPCCPRGDRMTLIAAGKGHLGCLDYAIYNQFPIHTDACNAAAAGNHVGCLDLLRENNAIWTEDTTHAAAVNGSFEALYYLIENYCTYSDDLLVCAAAGGSRNCVRYLVEERGLEMSVSVFGAAFERAHLDCVTYLIDTGCPVHGYTFRKESEWYLCRSYHTGPDVDERFLNCILWAADRAWNSFIECPNLVEYILDNSNVLRLCKQHVTNL